MRVVLRADASLDIGTGHVMRCLSLAGRLRDLGHECRFICRTLPGHLMARLEADGFAVTALPAPDAVMPPTPSLAHWAGVTWERDAAEVRAALPLGVDWLVVDHYAFDHRWEMAAGLPGCKIMALDDLANRVHACDLLVDQNTGRQDRDYDPLLPPKAERLTGPRFALLRPEFAALRPASLARRRAQGFTPDHGLIFMGGTDLPNATGQILRHLRSLLVRDGPLIRRLTVIMGPTAPALEDIRRLAADMPIPCTVMANVPDMAALMAEADIAFGAVGGAALERCVLGLPTLAVVLADNQTSGARSLAALGAAVVLGTHDSPDLSARISDELRRLSTPGALRAMSEAAARVTDGLGIGRVVAALEAPLVLQPSDRTDAETIWHWRQALPATAFASGPNPPLAAHLAWFEAALEAPGRHMFTARAPHPVGHARLDVTGDKTATISILIAPEMRGKGIGQRLLSLLRVRARALGLVSLEAEVHADNAASLALFRAADFAVASTRHGFCRMRGPA